MYIRSCPLRFLTFKQNVHILWHPYLLNLKICVKRPYILRHVYIHYHFVRLSFVLLQQNSTNSRNFHKKLKFKQEKHRELENYIYISLIKGGVLMINHVRGENIEVTPALREYVEKKMAKLERYFDEGVEAKANVNLKYYNDQESKIEVTIPMPQLVLRAEEHHADMYAAIDLVMDKLERQIRKHKTKVNRKLREQQADAKLFVTPTNGEAADKKESEEDIQVVRTKSFDLKPMDSEEAILQMDMLGHNFFVFTNAETNRTNVVYRRKDGKYGLIEPR